MIGHLKKTICFYDLRQKRQIRHRSFFFFLSLWSRVGFLNRGFTAADLRVCWKTPEVNESLTLWFRLTRTMSTHSMCRQVGIGSSSQVFRAEFYTKLRTVFSEAGSKNLGGFPVKRLPKTAVGIVDRVRFGFSLFCSRTCYYYYYKVLLLFFLFFFKCALHKQLRIDSEMCTQT